MVTSGHETQVGLIDASGALPCVINDLAAADRLHPIFVIRSTRRPIAAKRNRSSGEFEDIASALQVDRTTHACEPLRFQPIVSYALKRIRIEDHCVELAQEALSTGQEFRPMPFPKIGMSKNVNRNYPVALSLSSKAASCST